MNLSWNRCHIFDVIYNNMRDHKDTWVHGCPPQVYTRVSTEIIVVKICISNDNRGKMVSLCWTKKGRFIYLENQPKNYQFLIPDPVPRPMKVMLQIV